MIEPDQYDAEIAFSIYDAVATYDDDNDVFEYDDVPANEPVNPSVEVTEPVNTDEPDTHNEPDADPVTLICNLYPLSVNVPPFCIMILPLAKNRVVSTVFVG